MKISPFLKSANKALEYRVVSAPEKFKPYIIEHTKTDQYADGATIYRQDVNTPEGLVALFFRRKVAPGFKDMQGRDIYRTDGISISGAGAERFAFHPSYLEEAERINERYFKEFWQWSSQTHPTINPVEEISFKPHLTENLKNTLVRPPIDLVGASKLYADAAAEKKTGKSAAGAMGKENGSDGTVVQRSREAGRTGFQKGAIIALGALGIGLMAHGAIAALNARQIDNGGSQVQRDWLSTLLHIGEAGIGASMTWIAYMNGRSHIGVRNIR